MRGLTQNEELVLALVVDNADRHGPRIETCGPDFTDIHLMITRGTVGHCACARPSVCQDQAPHVHYFPTARGRLALVCMQALRETNDGG